MKKILILAGAIITIGLFFSFGRSNQNHDYVLVGNQSQLLFQRYVNEYLNKGYIPVGSPIIDNKGYTQAMYK